MRRLVVVLLLLSACPEADPDRRVTVAFRLRDVTPGDLVPLVQSVTWGVRALRLRPCDEPPVVLDWPGVPLDVRTLPSRVTPQPWTVGLTGDLLVGLAPHPGIPVGPWCRFDVVVDGPLRIRGSVPATGGTFRLDLDVPSLGMPFEVPFAAVELETEQVGDAEVARAVVRPLVLELGAADWADPIADELAAGATVVVGPGDPRHDALVAALTVAAALYVDLDEDRRVGPEEREEAFLSGLVPIE